MEGKGGVRGRARGMIAMASGILLVGVASLSRSVGWSGKEGKKEGKERERSFLGD